MARETKTTKSNDNQPAFTAWHVSETAKKVRWKNVGAAWSHENGEGMTLQLKYFPVNGRIMLFPNRPYEEPIEEGR